MVHCVRLMRNPQSRATNRLQASMARKPITTSNSVIAAIAASVTVMRPLEFRRRRRLKETVPARAGRRRR